MCTQSKQDALDKLAPEGNFYRHLDEGYDDMPAHVKVGSWVWFCEREGLVLARAVAVECDRAATHN